MRGCTSRHDNVDCLCCDAHDDELGIGDAHHLHVFNGYFSHELIRQTWFEEIF